MHGENDGSLVPNAADTPTGVAAALEAEFLQEPIRAAGSDATPEFCDGRHRIEITKRTAGSAVWLVITRLATKGLDFATLLILARLLTPADFGIIAIAMTLVSLIEAVFEIPVYQVLVGLDVIDRGHLDTAFTLGALRGLVMAPMLIVLAVPFAYFYGDHRLIGLIAALSLAPAMRGIVSPRMVTFARNLNFLPELAQELSCKVGSFVFASIAAWVFHDYRALMVGILANPAIWVSASYVFAPYRPRFSLSAWPLFAHFMSWVTASQVLTALNWQCDRLVLGLFVSRAELGSFSLANDLSFIPEQALIKPIVRPLISAFALIRDDRERLVSAYLKTSNTVLAIGAPVLLGLSLLADPAVRFALGGKWIAAIPILQWLSLTLIPPLISSPFAPLAMVINRPQAILRQAAVETFSKVPIMILGATLFGVHGAVAARGISTVLAALIGLYLAKTMIGASVRQQLAATWRTATGGVVLIVVLLVLRPLLAGTNGLMLGIELAGASAVGLTSYIIAIGFLWRISGRPGGIERIVFDRALSPLLYRIAVFRGTANSSARP